MKKIFFDVETTGVNPNQHSIHQLAGLIEIDGKIVERFDYKMRPHPKAKIEPEALSIGQVSESDIMEYPLAKTIHMQFLSLLAKYIDRYNKKDKAYLVGYNNRHFDDSFLRKHFDLQEDAYFGSWFWSDSLDALVLASEYLKDRRPNILNFQLATVALELGIVVDLEKTHNAFYDVSLTRQVYRIVTGIDIEI